MSLPDCVIKAVAKVQGECYGPGPVRVYQKKSDEKEYWLRLITPEKPVERVFRTDEIEAGPQAVSPYGIINPEEPPTGYVFIREFQ